MFQAQQVKKFIKPTDIRMLAEVFDYFDTQEILNNEDGACIEMTGNPFFDLLLDICTSKVESIVKEELYPTYAFARKYLRGSKLSKHTDREACVYTCSLTIEADESKSWPIYYEVDGEAKRADTIQGDALIIKGVDIPHWREPLESDNHLQIFLHYVPKTEDYEKLKFDGRKRLTLDANTAGINPAENEFDDRLDLYFEAVYAALNELTRGETQHERTKKEPG